MDKTDAEQTKQDPVTDAEATPAKQKGKRAKPSQAAEAEKAAPDPDATEPKPRRNRQNQNKRNQNKKPRAETKVIEIAPSAGPARMRKRHWGVILSFFLLVLMPVVLTVWYLWWVAEDQYASTVGFTVRQDEGGAATDLLGGVAAQITGGSGTNTDSDILYEFIQSQDLVSRLNEKYDLVGHYSQNWTEDPLQSLWPGASIEDLVWYWGRVVRTSYDQSTGLIELRVLAFDPDYAQMLASEILEESQVLINNLNQRARDDMMRFAQDDLDASLDRLKASREALTLFRTRTQIVDPLSDLQGRLGVVNNLQQQLAEALIEQDLLLEQSTSDSNPRLEQAASRIEVIRNRIAQEREAVASGEGEDYPSLLAEYEGLIVDREFAEESYRAALTALDVARNNAVRQSRYLATYVAPTYPETAHFPRRFVVFGVSVLFLLLTWSILILIYYSVRDSR